LAVTSVYPPIAGISALRECINCLINNSFYKLGFFGAGNFVHYVWFIMIVISNLKTFRKQYCQTQNYFLIWDGLFKNFVELAYEYQLSKEEKSWTKLKLTKNCYSYLNTII
jgi:hypothetical protein